MEKHNQTHKISPYAEKVIRDIIAEKTQYGMSAAYQEYLKNNALVKHKDRPKYPTYEGLRELLDALDVRYIDFFRRVNICPTATVDWATPMQKSMANHLDAMSAKQKSAVMETVKALLSDEVATALQDNEHNKVYGLRITNVLEKCANEDNNMYRIYTELGMQSKWRQNKRNFVMYSSVPHEYMPAISNKTGVSLHWLLGWDAPVLAMSAETEKVMDYYCFLSAQNQITLEQAVTTTIKSGGIVLG